MRQSLTDLKVLIVHPFMNYYGGAEYMLHVIANELFPNADILTLAADESVVAETNIRPERIKTPARNIFHTFFRPGTLFYPAIVDSWQPNASYDLVLSLSYAYVHGIVTAHTQPHISYIHSPMRLLWMNESEYYGYNNVPLVRELYRSILTSQRLWDVQAAARPDYLVSSSQEVQRRVSSFWGRASDIISPPVDIDFFSQGTVDVQKEDYYVTHSRLVRFKRVDILIDLFKQLKQKLVILGDGPEYRKLKRIAGEGNDIVFMGHVADAATRRTLLQKARGYVYASFEDFGISPVEAMAAGLPVFAYGRGGVAETVNKDSGILVPEQSTAAFLNGWNDFQQCITNFDYKKSFSHLGTFSRAHFLSAFKNYIGQKIQEFTASGPPVFRPDKH